MTTAEERRDVRRGRGAKQSRGVRNWRGCKGTTRRGRHGGPGWRATDGRRDGLERLRTRPTGKQEWRPRASRGWADGPHPSRARPGRRQTNRSWRRRRGCSSLPRAGSDSRRHRRGRRRLWPHRARCRGRWRHQRTRRPRSRCVRPQHRSEACRPWPSRRWKERPKTGRSRTSGRWSHRPRRPHTSTLLAHGCSAVGHASGVHTTRGSRREQVARTLN